MGLTKHKLGKASDAIPYFRDALDFYKTRKFKKAKQATLYKVTTQLLIDVEEFKTA